MLFVKLPEKLFYIEFFAWAGFQLAYSHLDFGAQIFQRLDAIEKRSAKLFLCRLGKRGDLTDSDFQCLDHAGTVPHFCRPTNCGAI